MPQATLSDVADLLRADASQPPASEWSRLIEEARAHGVLPLIADIAIHRAWDPDLVARLRPELAAQTALALVNERELRRVLEGFAAVGVRPLLFKGAHLAYAIYRAPELRPRIDTDLLVPDVDRAAAIRTLERVGYAPVPHVNGDVAFGQMQFGRTDDSGARHTIDLHWRIANPRAFAERLSYDDLASDAVPIPSLGESALGPSAPSALLIASLHRTAHHHSSRRILWLYDVHLLAASLADRAWHDAVEVAISKGLAPVIASALIDTADTLGTHVPDEMMARLREHADHADRDVLKFLDGRMSQADVAMSDLRRLRGLRQRARFLREHLFPSASYIQHRYGTSSRLALPILYTHRIVSGARKWF